VKNSFVRESSIFKGFQPFLTKELNGEKLGYKGTDKNNKKSLSNADPIRVSARLKGFFIFTTKENFFNTVISYTLFRNAYFNCL
jgi:hypothetical protein